MKSNQTVPNILIESIILRTIIVGKSYNYKKQNNNTI